MKPVLYHDPEDAKSPVGEAKFVTMTVQNRVNAERGAAMIGRRIVVLVEGVSSRDAGRWTGRNDGNMICVFDAPPENEDWRGQLVEVESATPLTLFCKRVGA